MIDTSKIPQPAGEYKSIKKNGSTNDIIKSINGMDNYYSPKFCEFSQQFSGGKEGLRKLWSFVKYKIKYQKDEFSKSKQLAPPALWEIKKGDCKSKTLFINAVLRCLEIPYIIRYTNYNKRDRHFKHVYTVAIYQGKELPIDSVYDFFGIEKKFNQKKDFKTMPEIIEISGIEPTKRTVKKNFGCFQVGEVAAKVTELKQKQKYVKKPEPILFSKISEGQASIEIAIRELEIMKVMKPKLAKIADIGLKMLQKAKKGNFCLTGNIPNELRGTAYNIKQAETKQHIRANGYGLAAQRTKQNNKIGINGQFTGMFCLNGLFRQQSWKFQTTPAPGIVKDDFNYISPTQNWLKFHSGMCMRNFGDWGDISLKNVKQYNPTDIYQAYAKIPPTVPPGYNIPPGYNLGDNSYFTYGSDSKYRSTFNEMRSDFETAISSLISRQIAKPKDPNVVNSGDYSIYIESKANYDTIMDELRASSGVMDKYINEIMSANGIENPNGTMGSGLFYSFADGVTVNNKIISPNRMPNTVTSKKGFQDQFLDSIRLFTGISTNSSMGLARNGILYDNGGTQPEETLSSLLAIYEHRYNQAGIGWVSAVIAGIIGLITLIINAVIAAEERSTLAEIEANNIDTYKRTTSGLKGIGASLMPEQNDFLPGEQEEEKRNNTLLLLAAAGTVGYIATKKKK